MRFPVKITSSAIGLLYLSTEIFYIGMPVMRTDGRSVGVRSRDYQIFLDGYFTITLPHFLTHGAPLRASRAGASLFL